MPIQEPGTIHVRPKHWGLVESMEDQLKEQLPQEHWELFTKYQDAERGADCISNADIFIEGFRMGARAIMDVLLTPKAHSS